MTAAIDTQPREDQKLAESEMDQIVNDAAIDLTPFIPSSDVQGGSSMYMTTDDHLLPDDEAVIGSHDNAPNEDQENLEIKDARIIFENVWNEIEREYGKECMMFPKEIIWLMGAPGAGKGTNVPFIMTERGITAEVIEVSHLLVAEPQTREVINKGWMVNDKTVLNLLLRRLLKEEYQNGAVVDGFPRTKVQVRFIKFLHDKMYELRREFFGKGKHFRRPQFRVCVLYID